jgi:DNA-binding transcriptional LysR family regulator
MQNIRRMNLRAVDLNLLVVLDAILDERSVSRAAKRIGLSQPATSAALNRCRHLFADRLLERIQGSTRLTPRAATIREPLKAILTSVAAVVVPLETDLKTVNRTVSLLMADALIDMVVPDLMLDLGENAPGIGLVILPWTTATNATGALVSGSCDLAVSVLSSGHAEIHRELLFEDTYKVLMRLDHPAAARFSLESWLGYPHAIVSRRGRSDTKLDEGLASLGLRGA